MDERVTFFKERDINDELGRKQLKIVQDLRALLEKWEKSKENAEKNKTQLILTESGLREFKEEIEDRSKEEKEIEKPNEIVDIVENTLEFNRQQQGGELKILTPNQMLSRLPVSLAQFKEGKNSEKL